MDWIALLIAGIFEIVWAIGLKYSETFTKLMPSIITIVGTCISFILLAYAMRTIPIGTAYVVWTGIGAIGTALFGMIFLEESTNLIRIACLLLIFGGILGLKLFH